MATIHSMSVRRRLAARIRSIDRLLAAAASTRRMLVELRTPMHWAVLGPVVLALQERGNVDVRFTSEYPDRIRPTVPPGRFLTHAQAVWRRFDLYLNADPWGAVTLKRCGAAVNFFHGVAGKYDLDQPVGLPMQFDKYNRVAFVNADRMRRYLDAQIVTRTQAVLVGYPKLDALARGALDGRAALAGIGFGMDRPAAVYAPTFSPHSSLQEHGEAIALALARAGFNVVVKLHDRSFDPDPRYSGGVDWRARFAALGERAPVRLVETADSSPWLAAASLLVTDHSSIGFEFLVLDRPLIVFDAPALLEHARVSPEKVALLRRAATVARTPAEVETAAVASRQDPARLSAARRRVVDGLFYDPGHATDRAVALIESLWPHSRRPRAARSEVPVGVQPEAR